MPFFRLAKGTSRTAQSRVVRRGIVRGDQVYTTAGSYTFVVPPGVSSVSVVVVGAGQNGGRTVDGGEGIGMTGSGGHGGHLAYKNNISVTACGSYTVVVGGPAPSSPPSGPSAGGQSYFCSSTFVRAAGGALGGANYGDASYSGGPGNAPECGGTGGGGAGGAGGYAGIGGTAAAAPGTIPASAGSGGAAGGGRGGSAGNGGGGGGGVGIYGQGGSGGAQGTRSGGGFGGSGGTNGSSGAGGPGGVGGAGGNYGGGGGNGALGSPGGGLGAPGAVRIVWPGSTRQFPSTDVSTSS